MWPFRKARSDHAEASEPWQETTEKRFRKLEAAVAQLQEGEVGRIAQFAEAKQALTRILGRLDRHAALERRNPEHDSADDADDAGFWQLYWRRRNGIPAGEGEAVGPDGE